MPRPRKHPKPLPLAHQWSERDNPLPRRAIRASGVESSASQIAMPSLDSGQRAHEPFDFCAAIHRLVMNIAIHCPDFRHLQVPRILVTITQARGQRMHGLQARVTPLRFSGGLLIRKRRGVSFQIQRYFLGDHEFLYLMTFCLPRFLDLKFEQKFITLFHELYHFGPAFDGDIRRHDGRCHIHTHSQREYDKKMAQHASAYLAGKPDPGIHAFFRYNFAQLQARHGSVTGIVVPHPKIIPLVGPWNSM